MVVFGMPRGGHPRSSLPCSHCLAQYLTRVNSTSCLDFIDLNGELSESGC